MLNALKSFSRHLFRLMKRNLYHFRLLVLTHRLNHQFLRVQIIHLIQSLLTHRNRNHQNWNYHFAMMKRKMLKIDVQMLLKSFTNWIRLIIVLRSFVYLNHFGLYHCDWTHQQSQLIELLTIRLWFMKLHQSQSQLHKRIQWINSLFS